MKTKQEQEPEYVQVVDGVCRAVFTQAEKEAEEALWPHGEIFGLLRIAPQPATAEALRSRVQELEASNRDLRAALEDARSGSAAHRRELVGARSRVKELEDEVKARSGRFATALDVADHAAVAVATASRVALQLAARVEDLEAGRVAARRPPTPWPSW